jgi:hypothetical protein
VRRAIKSEEIRIRISKKDRVRLDTILKHYDGEFTLSSIIRGLIHEKYIQITTNGE